MATSLLTVFFSSDADAEPPTIQRKSDIIRSLQIRNPHGGHLISSIKLYILSITSIYILTERRTCHLTVKYGRSGCCVLFLWPKSIGVERILHDDYQLNLGTQLLDIHTGWTT